MSSFGENLRRERELRGVSLRDIAEATKISTRFLEAIEQDRLEVLPGGMFPRSFVRQYARYLGLDADRIVAEFVFQHPPETKPPPSPPSMGGGEWGARAALTAVVVGLGLAALWFARPAPRQSDAPSGTVAAPPLESSPPASPVATVYRPDAPPADAGDVPSSTLAAAAPSEGELVVGLTALQDCWVAAEVDGEEVLNRVLSGGATRTLRAHEEIQLSVGNAGGLELTIDGRSGIFLGPPGAVRHDVVINLDNVAGFVAGSAAPAAPASSPSAVAPTTLPQPRPAGGRAVTEPAGERGDVEDGGSSSEGPASAGDVQTLPDPPSRDDAEREDDGTDDDSGVAPEQE